MALVKSKSKKCPVCVGCTPSKVDEIDGALASLLAEVKATGEIPKTQDSRLSAVANVVGIAPASLRYHLKECLVEVEIQDQRFQEFKDVVEAIQTAKQEYLINPGKDTASAYAALLNVFRALAEDLEGQQDPEVTVEFLTANVLGPVNRRVLSSVAEELRSLRESIYGLISDNQRPYMASQVNSVMSRISSALRESTDDSLKALCSYYKVELETQQRKRALDTATPPSLTGSEAKSSTKGDIVH